MSYESVLTAHRLPRETPDEQSRRNQAIQLALTGAVNAPLEIARRATEVFERLGQLEPMAGPSMYSDVRVGRMMAATAVRGALENVATNLYIHHRYGLCRAAFVPRCYRLRHALTKVRSRQADRDNLDVPR